jgi:hypothetical protein
VRIQQSAFGAVGQFECDQFKCAELLQHRGHREVTEENWLHPVVPLRSSVLKVLTCLVNDLVDTPMAAARFPLKSSADFADSAFYLGLSPLDSTPRPRRIAEIIQTDSLERRFALTAISALPYTRFRRGPYRYPSLQLRLCHITGAGDVSGRVDLRGG